MKLGENQIQLGNRPQSKTSDVAIFASHLIARHEAWLSKNHLFHPLQLTGHGFQSHDGLERVAESRHVEINGKSPKQSAGFEPVHAFGCGGRRQPNRDTQIGHRNSSVLKETLYDRGVDRVNGRFGKLRHFELMTLLL